MVGRSCPDTRFSGVAGANMSLIEKLPELQGQSVRLEDIGGIELHHVTPHLAPDYALDVTRVISASPKMLEVLACFQKGDAKHIKNLREYRICGELDPVMETLGRLQKACELMEAEP